MKKLLVRLLLFLERNNPAIDEAERLIASLDNRVMRGERKRSYALNVLSGKYEVPKKDLAFLIELLIQVK